VNTESAFWCLRYIIENLLPGYFINEMQGLIIDTVVLNTYVRGYVPKLHNHFKKHKFGLYLLSNQWLATLFFKNLPAETTFRIWDLLFYHGIYILFEFALRILLYLEKKLLEKTDIAEFMVAIMEETMGIYDFDLLLQFDFDPPIRNGDIKIHRYVIQQQLKNGKNLQDLIS